MNEIYGYDIMIDNVNKKFKCASIACKNTNGLLYDYVSIVWNRFSGFQ